MKLTTVIGTTMVAIGLAGCSSTVVPTARPATPIPTVAPTPTATPVPTPTATPIPTANPTPMPQPGVTVTETCSNIPEQWAGPGPYPPNGLGTVTWHDLTVGDYLAIGVALNGDRITSSTTSIPPFGPDLPTEGEGWTQGSWPWSEWSAPNATAPVVSGSFTIPACAPSVRVTACDHAGTASGGAIAWSEPDYSTLTITGPAPSTFHFTLPASAGRYGPLTAGIYNDRLNGWGASVSGAFTIPACPG
jgi:hypothetical protein